MSEKIAEQTLGGTQPTSTPSEKTTEMKRNRVVVILKPARSDCRSVHSVHNKNKNHNLVNKKSTGTSTKPISSMSLMELASVPVMNVQCGLYSRNLSQRQRIHGWWKCRR